MSDEKSLHRPTPCIRRSKDIFTPLKQGIHELAHKSGGIPDKKQAGSRSLLPLLVRQHCGQQMRPGATWRSPPKFWGGIIATSLTSRTARI